MYSPENQIKVNINVSTFNLFENVVGNYNDIQSQNNFVEIVEEELTIEFPYLDITCSRAEKNLVIVYLDDQVKAKEIEQEVLTVLEKTVTNVYQNDWDSWTVVE